MDYQTVGRDRLQWHLLPALVFLLLAMPAGAAGGQLTGFAAMEGRLFANSPLYDGQARNDLSVTLQLEYSEDWQNGWNFAATPFVRLDSEDNRRSHADLRELYLRRTGSDWDLTIGLARVFWGATEFVHLVDIINQTDQVEDIDGDEKLGQPMVQLSLTRQWGALDLFFLPYFRERTFAGQRGRLRPPVAIDTDDARYQSGRGRHHLDVAARISGSLGSADIGLSWFTGTGRQPLLQPAITAAGQPRLLPFYEQISQFGIDMQMMAAEWLWKFEGLRRSGKEDTFLAATGGLEYTLYGVGGTMMDVGVILEYAWDKRPRPDAIAADNDLMPGLRLAINDQASTTLLAGVGLDLAGGAGLLRIEGERRLGDRWKLFVDGTLFFASQANDPLHPLRQDDFIRLELRRYF